MKIAYFDCFSGISGDMVLGALIDAGLDVDYLTQKLCLLKGLDFKLQIMQVSRHHLSGIKVGVVCKGKERIRTQEEVVKLIEGSSLGSDVKKKSLMIYQRLFAAEARVHRCDPREVHLHELGSLDTIVDIVGAIVGLDYFRIDRVLSSPLNLGYGITEFSDGEFPAPAPATCELLKNVPVYARGTHGELVTPTGAAIVSTLAERYTTLPEMRIERVGYGAGEKDLSDIPNFLRIFIAEQVSSPFLEDEVVMLETNIDDTPPFVYENLIEQLLKEGALDAYLIPLQMKKTRPGVLMGVIAPPDKARKLALLIFKETTTTGIRISKVDRFKLPRQMRQFETRYGKVSAKLISLDGRLKISLEYDDCKRIAKKHNLPLHEVYQWCLREIEDHLDRESGYSEDTYLS